MQTILLLKSAFLCVSRFFGLSSFDTVTTLILSRLASFLPFFEVIPEIFREIANNELECKVSGFSSEARKALLTHSWPGNVRELRQKIMGAVLQAQTGLVTKEHLELGITETTSITGFSLRNDEEDKERILRALKQADGNRKVAAELLGIGRTTLYNKLEEYGLKYKFEQP